MVRFSKDSLVFDFAESRLGDHQFFASAVHSDGNPDASGEMSSAFSALLIQLDSDVTSVEQMQCRIVREYSATLPESNNAFKIGGKD
jgi:hypothetical protein